MRNAWFVAVKDVQYQLRERATLVWLFLMPPVFFYFIGTVTGGGGGSGFEVVPLTAGAYPCLLVPEGFSASIQRGEPVTVRYVGDDPDLQNDYSQLKAARPDARRLAHQRRGDARDRAPKGTIAPAGPDLDHARPDRAGQVGAGGGAAGLCHGRRPPLVRPGLGIAPAVPAGRAAALPSGWAMDALHHLVSFGVDPLGVVPHVSGLVLGAWGLGWLGARRFRFQ